MSVGIIRNVIKNSDLPTSIHTFADVQKVLNAHAELERLSVGMEMDEVTVGSEPMVWIIGNISSGEVIFVPKWCLATTRQMNSTNTNVGGWNSSALRTWLNGDFYNSLPDTVKPYIKSRTFKTSAGNQSTSLQSATDKIWLPREYEVFGATTNAAATEHTDGGAEQFSIFATSANRIKTHGKTGSAYAWWESSPSTSNATSFCVVDGNGASDYISASNLRGVAPCFRMTPDGGGVELVDINPNRAENSDGEGSLVIGSSSNSDYIMCFNVCGYKKFSVYCHSTLTQRNIRWILKDGTTTNWVSIPSGWCDFQTVPNNAKCAQVKIRGDQASRMIYMYYSLLAKEE